MWSQQGSKLTGGEEGNSEFGVLVSLSADGNTALVGGWKDNGTKGAAWVFTRTGGVWSQQGPKLTPDGWRSEKAGFGTSVALSADGNTALIGAPGDDGSKGAAWVFTRSGSTWTQQGGKLTGGGEQDRRRLVRLHRRDLRRRQNGAGRRLARRQLERGRLGVHPLGLGAWSQQGPKLTGGAEETEEGMFGTNVTLSADGNTALIGAWNDDKRLRRHTATTAARARPGSSPARAPGSGASRGRS